VIERRVQVLPGYGPGTRIKPSLNMSAAELRRLSDHDLLVLLHERMDRHEREHQSSVSSLRWTIGIVLTTLLVIVGAASAVASWGR